MGKRYKCPYCEKRDERKKLIDHIDKRHQEMLPDGYDGARVMYDKINHTDGHGICRVCKKDTPWNPKAQRYDVLCGNPKCKEAMREEYKKNMLRVRGTYNILNDPQQQEKMLANRSISGKYKFKDGGIVTYTGSYEKKFLEFIDEFMEIPSKDIMMPGPTLEYTYKGEKHFYITDCLYIPFNAIIEIKDGGNNPNNKLTPGMIASREKTIQKEKLITDRGEYNYIRLTNNDFTQLIEFFMEIKEKILNDDPSMTVRIHETSVSSELDKNYKTKGKKSLSDFKCIKINEDNIKQFKELKHLRTKNCDGYMYLDGDNLACFYNTEHKDNGEYWIQAIEVLPLYKNYSLGTQLLKKCESLGANRLSVNKSNKVAINMYKKNGWEEYDNSNSMIFMSKGTIKESYLEESFAINEKDLYINFDKFESGKSNILLITGLSGSGKSTLAANLAKKYKCENFELDCLDFYLGGYLSKEKAKKYEPALYDFIEKKNLKQDKNLSSNELYKEYIKYIISWCKKRKDTKYIIEGLQIYEVYEDGDSFITSNPIIIKGTSALISSIRAAKRNEGPFLKEFKDLIKWAIKDSKSMKKLKNSLKEDYIEESSKSNYSYVKLETDKDIEDFRKSFKAAFKQEPDYTDAEARKGMKAIKYNDKVIGYIGFSHYTIKGKKYLGIGNFMIKVEYQNSGYGAEVVKDIVEKNKSKYDEIYCYVEKENTGAIRFYKRIAKVGTTLTKYGYYVTFYKKK